MTKLLDQKSEVLDAIRNVASQLGHAPSRREFQATAGVSEYQILRHFPSWREAVRASGLVPDSTNIRLGDEVLLEDWGALVRKHRHMPTPSSTGGKAVIAQESLRGISGHGQQFPKGFARMPELTRTGQTLRRCCR